MFENILNWELKAGSHEFPGPEGGTCINEAAIVAAGYEYRSVNSAYDCPPCFCPILSEFAITVNDRLPDDLRNEMLMPLVMKLSGSVDTKNRDIRLQFIYRELKARFDLPARKYARDINDVFDLLIQVEKMPSHYELPVFDYPFTPYVATKEMYSPMYKPKRIGFDRVQIWTIAAEVLKQAFLIGNQAPPLTPTLVAERMEKVKTQAREKEMVK